MGRRRATRRGEALDVPVTASAGFCELQYFLGCESPLGWVVHYLSLVQGSQEAHLPPFFFWKMPLNDMSYALFLQKNPCIVQVSVCLRTATPENACMLPLFQSSQKSLCRCHRSVYHVLTDCAMKGSWPNCMAWICPGCSGLELGSAFSPETRFGPKT